MAHTPVVLGMREDCLSMEFEVTRPDLIKRTSCVWWCMLVISAGGTRSWRSSLATVVWEVLLCLCCFSWLMNKEVALAC